MHKKTSYDTERNSIKDIKAMHHLIPPKNNPNAESAPDPELSPNVRKNVLLGSSNDIAVDLKTIEDHPTICIVCGVDFKTRAGLHVHLTSHKHLRGKLEPHLHIPIYQCKYCSAEVNPSIVLRHRCYMKHTEDILKVEALMDNVGSPLVCIFCRGRILPSRAHLMAHLVSAHSPHRNPFRCVFCHTKFQSDCLIMQEMHIFDHHVPELLFLNRLAYFKAIKSALGGTIDTSVPFLCLYDSNIMEQKEWWDELDGKLSTGDAAPTTVDTSFSPGHPINRQHLCSMSFSNLAEYTAHLYCVHTYIENEKRHEEVMDPEAIANLEKRQKRIPGPTIRQMMHGPPSGANTTTETKSQKPSKHGRVLQIKHTCRICLQGFEDDDSMKSHLISYHIPESEKRIQHLISTGELTHVLKVDLLCTECFTLFKTTFQLQVHLMVAHSGNSWCTCGICGQKFCEEDKTIPTILTIGVNESDDEDNQNNDDDADSPPKATIPTIDENYDQAALPYVSQIPILTLCRILETHEAKHCAELLPPARNLFLPKKLINQILTSRGNQAAQIANWLNICFDEKPNSIINAFNYEDPNDKKKNKGGVLLRPGEDPLQEVTMEQSIKSLTGLTERNKKRDSCVWKIADEEKDKDSRYPQQKSIPYIEVTGVTGTTVGRSSIEKPKEKPKLSPDVARVFTQLGEENAVLQAEIEFMDTL